MRNDVQSLAPDVAAAAAAIANARAGRRSAPAIANILDVLPVELFAAVVEDARAALKASAEVGTAAPASQHPRGPLNAADASALGKRLDAGTLVILSRDRASRPTAAVWAAGAGAWVMDEHGAGQLWAAFVAISRKLGEAQA